MPKPGPRTISRYSEQFKATAVRLSQLPGVRVRRRSKTCFAAFAPHLMSGIGVEVMAFKETRQRERFKKKVQRGFRGYPVATVAYYGPTDQHASKAVVAIIKAEDAEAKPMEKWFSDTADVRNESKINEEIFRFIEENAPKSIVIADCILGCPHEEGIDYPEGGKCSECPFWRNRDRFSGHVIQ